MTESLKQTIKERLVSLPKEIQDAVNSMDWVKISEEIGKKYFTEDVDINAFQTEITLVLIRLANLYSFAQNIEDNIAISKETAIEIKNETVQKIFKPITDKINENVKKNVKDKTMTWDQNINFILSGGDYSAFLQKANVQEKMVDTPIPEKTPMNYSRVEDLKNKFTI